MAILYITRSYSNNKGGKEIYNYNLVNSLKNKEDIKLISTSGSIFNLIWFYPYSFILGLYYCFSKDVKWIHTGDTFMLPVTMVLTVLFNKKLSLTIYGLDITYNSIIYQSIFTPLARKCDKIIVISKATKDEVIKKGIKEEKIIIIPCGINIEEFQINNPDKVRLKKEIENQFNLDLKNKKIIITVGRLVKRKGVEWFIENVMPKLNKDYIYLVSGEGEEKENIKKTIEQTNQKDKVFMLGRTDNITLKKLYHISDVFIMPNIKVEGDMEGFGIVAIEASSVGLPIVASNIEGIKDAIQNNKTGILVNEKDVNGFIKAIKSANKLNKIKMKSIIKNNFSWDIVAKEYLEVWK